ncbi:MAG: GNAT family N-acetyltransferase [Bacteroidota bacterium]
MEFDIRKANPPDFNDIHRLIKEFATFIKHPEKVMITPEQMLRDQDHFKCLVATYEEKIVGFATYFICYYSWTGKAIYLDDLYVVEKYRGLGMGNKLFDQVMKIGRDENCYKMKWQVSRWNEKAQEFYRGKGATIEDVEINCDLALSSL